MVDVRVRCVLRRLGVDTIEQLLSLTEAELLTQKNCGPKTTGRILGMQAEYGKDRSPQKAQGTIDKAVESSRTYMNRLIGVAIDANELIGGAKKSGRYYVQVTRQQFNSLKLALEMLRKHSACG